MCRSSRYTVARQRGVIFSSCGSARMIRAFFHSGQPNLTALVYFCYRQALGRLKRQSRGKSKCLEQDKSGDSLPGTARAFLAWLIPASLGWHELGGAYEHESYLRIQIPKHGDKARGFDFQDRRKGIIV